MRALAAAIIAWVFLAVPVPSRAGSELAPACGAPEEFITADETLAQVTTAVAAGGPLGVLAVGSATTVETVSTAGPETSFPWQMLHELQLALPAVKFSLTVRGGRGMTAEQMLTLMSTELKQKHFQLVIWQTGTVEAVRGLRPDGMLNTLHDGADVVRDAGADLVLIDPQFSRFLRANTDLAPYEDVMQQVATLPGVVLFQRFELMRAWADDGRIDLERTPKADRDKALAELNTCLGQALARFVLSGIDAGKK
jgi:acyl-CoA thioesterase-1